MKPQYVRVSKRSEIDSGWFISTFIFFGRSIKFLLPLLGTIVPATLLVVLYVLGIPGLLISDGTYACNYIDLVGTFGGATISGDCPFISFRKIDLIPYLK